MKLSKNKRYLAWAFFLTMTFLAIRELFILYQVSILSLEESQRWFNPDKYGVTRFKDITGRALILASTLTPLLALLWYKIWNRETDIEEPVSRSND